MKYYKEDELKNSDDSKILLHYKISKMIFKGYKTKLIKKESIFNYLLDKIWTYKKCLKKSKYSISKKKHSLMLKKQKLCNYILIKVGNFNDKTTITNKKYSCFALLDLKQKNTFLLLLSVNDHENKKLIIKYIKEYIKENTKKNITDDDLDSTVNDLLKFLKKFSNLSKNKKVKFSPYKGKILISSFSSPKKFDNYETPNISNLKAFEYLYKLINITDDNTSLSILGYFLYSNFYKNINDKNYKYALNLYGNDRRDVYGIFSLYNEIFQTKKYSKMKNTLIYNSKHTDNLLNKIYAYQCGIVAIDCFSYLNKTSEKNLYDNIISICYEKKHNKFPVGIVLLSKKEIYNNLTYNIILKNINTYNIISSKKNIICIKETLLYYMKYLRYNIYMDERYLINKIYDTILQIHDNSSLSIEEDLQLCGIVTVLQIFFDFLLESKSISDEEYEILSSKCESLYCPTTNKNNLIPSEPNTLNYEQIAELIAKYIFDEYNKERNAFKTDLGDDPCIYSKSNTEGDILCFKHDESTTLDEIITFLWSVCNVKQFISLDNMSDEDKKRLFKNLKNIWRSKELLYSSSGRITYTAPDKKSYIAFKVLNLKKYFG